jgi:hypothetical protein
VTSPQIHLRDIGPRSSTSPWMITGLRTQMATMMKLTLSDSTTTSCTIGESSENQKTGMTSRRIWTPMMRTSTSSRQTHPTRANTTQRTLSRIARCSTCLPMPGPPFLSRRWNTFLMRPLSRRHTPTIRSHPYSTPSRSRGKRCFSRRARHSR